MNHKIRGAVRVAVAALLLQALVGCALFPGMSFKRGKTEVPDSSKSDGYRNQRIPLIRIDAEAIRNQLDWRQAGSVPPSVPDFLNYKIGIGDILEIIVWGHPELTFPSSQAEQFGQPNGRTVKADGTIFFPFAGNIVVAGKTSNAVAEELSTKLSRVYRSPQVEVSIKGFRSQKVRITGTVGMPRTIPVTDVPLTLFEALGQSGGVNLEEASGYVHVWRDKSQFTFDLNSIIEHGGPGTRFVLQDGDTVYVPSNADDKIFLIGEISQKIVHMKKGKMSLNEAIAQAGGVNTGVANGGGIYVIRDLKRFGPDGEIYHNPVVYGLNMKSANSILLADQFQLASRDVVFVSTAPISRFNRIIRELLPTVNLLFQADVLSRQ